MQGAGPGLYCAGASRTRADDPAQDARGGRPATTQDARGARPATTQDAPGGRPTITATEAGAPAAFPDPRLLPVPSSPPLPLPPCPPALFLTSTVAVSEDSPTLTGPLVQSPQQHPLVLDFVGRLLEKL